MPLLPSTLEFFRSRALDLKPGLAAISGGADSVALAHVLGRLKKSGQLPSIGLIHLNHQLRGEDSDGDEAFVKSLPETWQMPELAVHTQRIDVAAFAKREGLNLEDAGRRARYVYFAEVAAETGEGWVATAHTSDDQAETVLLRLLRGAGLAGLAGIPDVRPLAPSCRLARPWLGIRKTQVREYLAQHQLDWREDASNQSDRFTRNRIRNQLMPLLERDFQPSLVPLLNRLALQANEVSEYLREQAELLRARAERPRAGEILVFDVDMIQGVNSVLVREMFRLVWSREGWPMGEMGAEEWEVFPGLAEGSVSAVDLPGGVHARRKGRVIQVARNRPR